MPFRSEQPELHRYQALMLVQRGRPADRPLATGELSVNMQMEAETSDLLDRRMMQLFGVTHSKFEK